MKNMYWNKTTILIGLMLIFFWGTQSCKYNTALSETEKENYLTKGKIISSNLFGVLLKAVSNSLKNDGVVATIDYCKLNAYPLTDSLAKVHKAHIRRTSHKVRNLKNTPDSLEQVVLQTYLKQHKKLEETPEILVQQADKVHYFAPIFVAAPCLKCHGKINTDISKVAYTAIGNAYPQDRAINFEAGAIRGIWSISFDVP